LADRSGLEDAAGRSAFWGAAGAGLEVAALASWRLRQAGHISTDSPSAVSTSANSLRRRPVWQTAQRRADSVAIVEFVLDIPYEDRQLRKVPL
jgi:hypothetical protein